MSTTDDIPQHFLCTNFNSLNKLYGEEFVLTASQLCEKIISSDLVDGVKMIRSLIDNVQVETIKKLVAEGRVL